MNNKPMKIRHFFIKIVSICAICMTSQVASASDDIEKVGDALLVLIPAIGLGNTIFNEEGDEGTIQFAKSFIATTVITLGLKKAINRTRPNGECCDSFPSGHTSGAFMGAAFIQKRYGWKYGIPAYIGAAFVGYSRIESDKHHVTDVLAGAAIGIVSSYFFTKPYKGFEVTPLAGNGVYGLSIHKSW